MPAPNEFLEQNQIDDYRSCFTGSGFTPDDFELTQQRDQPTGIVYDPQAGKVTVRCKRTGIEKVYELHSGNTWPSQFDQDLHRRVFSRNA